MGLRSRTKAKGRSLLAQLNGLRVNPTEGIVVNGFWRSGTTWVQELAAEALGTQTLFEPLQARAGYIQSCLAEIGVPRQDDAFVNTLMPYAATTLRPRSRLKRLVSRALHGQLTNAHVRRRNNALKGYLGSPFVVKFTRGALFLESLVNTFAVPVLHVHRDPRASIASIKRYESWGTEIFDFSLCAHFLEVDDGRRAYFTRWEDEIRALDREEVEMRIAGYWGLTERFVKDTALEKSRLVVSVGYEEAVRTGGRGVLKALEKVSRKNFEELPEDKRNQSSSTDYRGRSGEVSTEERLYAWRSELPPAQQEAIAGVAERFGCADYLLS